MPERCWSLTGCLWQCSEFELPTSWSDHSSTPAQFYSFRIKDPVGILKINIFLELHGDVVGSLEPLNPDFSLLSVWDVYIFDCLLAVLIFHIPFLNVRQC